MISRHRGRLFHAIAGNADVVRQELAKEKGVLVSPRTLQRAVAPYRQALKAEALVTTRFETPPGRQLQIDFGERFVDIAGLQVKAFVFVATLGHSRLRHVRAFRNESQACWFEGLESAFAAFGGVPAQILIDNPRALVTRHDSASRIVQFNEKFLAFASPRIGACPRAPARPIGRARKARPSAASATSRQTLLLAGVLRAGQLSKRTWLNGSARLPMCAFTARRGRRRSHASCATKSIASRRWPPARPSARCANYPASSAMIAPSRSIPTSIPCPGG